MRRSISILLISMSLLAVSSTAAPDPQTRNVVLVTLDGVRIQELFGGLDPAIVAAGKEASGIYDLERALNRYWRPTRVERRDALMPWFWETLAHRGIVLGDKSRGSRVTVTNPLLFSGPGYFEILTGRYQPDVVSNEIRRYPHRTVLEFVQEKLQLGPTEVATVGSWKGFSMYSSREPGTFFTNGGYTDVPEEIATPRMEYLSDLQHQIMTAWETGRSDAVTVGIALEFLREYRPRLLYLALDESDDWTHARRYDRYLDYMRVVDGFLRRLWTTIQSLDSHRGSTTLILTTDHGRGVTPEDWVEHGADVPGSEDIWVAVIGPDTPDRGAVAEASPVHQADVAATLLRLFDLDPGEFDPRAGPAIEAAFAPAEAAATPPSSGE